MLNINNHYNFSLYANSILGHSYRNARLTSILDYRTAVKFGNIDLIHRQVFPYLPPGTPSDHTKYTYYIFEHGNKKIVIAAEWLVTDSVEQTTGKDHTLTIYNVTPDQVGIIRDQLRLLGIQFDIV